MASMLRPGEEWRLELDAERGLWLVVLAHPGYFDFHLADASDTVLASVFGYAQRISVVPGKDEEPGGWLEVGGTLIYIPRDQALSDLGECLGRPIT